LSNQYLLSNKMATQVAILLISAHKKSSVRVIRWFSQAHIAGRSVESVVLGHAQVAAAIPDSWASIL
jgi:hypothetical protein